MDETIDIHADVVFLYLERQALARYKSGVFGGDACKETTGGHALTMMGYGTQAGKK